MTTALPNGLESTSLIHEGPTLQPTGPKGSAENVSMPDSTEHPQRSHVNDPIMSHNNRQSQMKMKSAGVVDGGLFTESYCNICNAQLISESQRTAHYESKKHANKVRLFYMLHPEDGGPPSKRLRPDNPDCAETEVDRNKCCTLCNMFFTSAIVAQSHYQGKTHAKRVRLVLGEPPTLPTAISSPTNFVVASCLQGSFT
uniref:U1-type domain-containing protein n=1 Tax=Amphiprion ocellaris TaxID=80972 RepID=A0A3Q1B2K6_AMPOC